MTISSVSTFSNSLLQSEMSNNQVTIQPIVEPTQPAEKDPLTPEQKNKLQDNVDDKLAEQVENIKSNYQSAKDIELMQAYYQQQQKLLDIYLQSSTESNNESNSQNTSAVASLINAYTELYQLHKNVKEGVVELPGFEVPTDEVEILPINTSSNINQVVEQPANSINQALSHKQMDAYNGLMMPSTSSYLHLSA